jgi:hypothetical protein
MKSIKHALVALTAAFALASCGGGGGDGGAFNPPPPTTPAAPTVTITPSATQTTPNSLVPFTVRVNAGSGAPIPDGTTVTVQVTTSGIGLVSSVAPTAVIGERVTAPTAGGIATFRFHSRQLGTATIQASITEPTAPNRVITQTQNFTVAAGAPSDPRLTLAPVITTLPVNPNNFLPFVGSPYMAEVTVTWRTLDGALVSGNNPRVAVSVNPVNPTGGFSTLDDPATPDINEFQVRLGQGPVNVVAGRATLFFHSFNLPATATMTVTAVDPQLGDTIFATQEFRIVSGAPALPSSIVVEPVDDSPVFIQGGAGATSKQFEAFVFDGASALVPNPPAGTNNIRVELVPGSQGGDRLRAVDAAGANVTGPTISIRSLNGIGSFVYESGTRSGLVTIRVTADRADNNVTNGITDPVTSTRQITVSDGTPFDLVITSPTQNAITVNPAATGVTPPTTPGQPPAVPPNPNGSYSLTVSALVTDRQGNPVPAGTPVRFGLIDAPQDNGRFQIAGTDGNPQEGGVLFTAPTGAFTTAGGGAGPGDTLLVFGKEVPGNRDLESARVVASINSATSLSVRDRFNFNDDTGSTVDAGPVLPYVIGRATSGNITATGITDARGVARTVMTYPVSRLGRLAGVWAQTNADIRNGSPEVATDVAFLRFAGAAPFSLTAAPTAIRGNRTQAVTVCVRDALGASLQGVSVGFAFDFGTSGGNGSVDGVASAGVVPNVTGTNGCVVANVTTSGMQNSNGEPKITFTVTSGGQQQTAVVNIRVGELLLVANPADFFGNGEFTTALSLLDQNGVGVAGVQLAGNCTVTAPGSLVVGPIAPTDANGETRVTLFASNFNQIGSAPTATCTFRTASGTPNTTVRVTGFDFCEIFDPTEVEGCPGYVAPGRLTVSTRQTQATPPAAGGANPQGTISTIPAGISCSFNGANSGECTALFRGATTVQFATASGVFCRWEGACSGPSPLTTATVPPNGAVVCTAVVATNAANCAGP